MPAADADEKSVTLRQRLLDLLTSAEIAAADALASVKAEPELRQLTADILGRGPALGYAHRVALLRLADRLFQDGLSDLGAGILRCIAALPPLTGRPDVAYQSGDLYLRLSQVTLRGLNEFEQSAALARQGLDAVAAGTDERTASVRQRLLESVLAAEIAGGDAILAGGREADLQQTAERILALQSTPRLPYRLRLARLAELAFAKEWRAAGQALLASATQSLEPVSELKSGNPAVAGQLYVRWAQIMLRYLNEPGQAAQLARQGLETVADSNDEACVRLQRQLQDILAKAAPRS